jgi:hypothetical protein
MKRIYTGAIGYCDVFEDANGALYLIAACAGLVWRRVGIVLSTEEEAAFRTDPASAEKIAERMCHDFGPFEDRDILKSLRDAFEEG